MEEDKGADTKFMGGTSSCFLLGVTGMGRGTARAHYWGWRGRVGEVTGLLAFASND